MQAGTMSHYEFGQTLFIYGGQQTKHTVQSDADTGLPTLMPWTVLSARLLFLVFLVRVEADL